ncbi:MAG: hypothetical protein IKE34_08830, partial [Paenibacillus sp.]|nr:hypothetical protein [Paenibacillus sp.]
IQDEFDEELPQMIKRADQLYSIDGKMLIEEVNAYFGCSISSEDYDTIGGWLYSQVEIPPMKGQRVTLDHALEFIIEDTYHLRITRILVKKIGELTPSMETHEDASSLKEAR